MDLTHGKYLGVDYGDVRTGLAECDISGMIAGPIGTVAEGGMRRTAERVKAEAESRGCKKIIIGLPRNMDGSEGGRVDTVRAFADILASITDIEIDFYDERMSTMVAYRFLGDFPWHKGNLHPNTAIWDSYMRRSPWSDLEKRHARRGLVFKIEKLLYRTLPKRLFLSLFARITFGKSKKAFKKNKTE